jgi:hypothetical protein
MSRRPDTLLRRAIVSMIDEAAPRELSIMWDMIWRDHRPATDAELMELVEEGHCWPALVLEVRDAMREGSSFPEIMDEFLHAITPDPPLGRPLGYAPR